MKLPHLQFKVWTHLQSFPGSGLLMMAQRLNMPKAQVCGVLQQLRLAERARCEGKPRPLWWAIGDPPIVEAPRVVRNAQFDAVNLLATCWPEPKEETCSQC